MKLNSTQLMVTSQLCGVLVALSAVVALVVAQATETSIVNILYVAAPPIVGLVGASLMMMRASHRIKTGTDEVLELTATTIRPLIGGDRAAQARSTSVTEHGGRDEFTMITSELGGVRADLVAAADERTDALQHGVSELFTVLARRNRRVADQQLALLERFDETADPSELATDRPKLVHLANRVRRNADGLLVLARADRPTTMKARVIDDVVRDAIAEIEEFTRIDVVALDKVLISGSAVSDLAHMLAELLDNAAAFSAPSTRVRVAGSHVNGGYELVVGDSGIGLTESRIEALNADLSRPPEVALSIGSALGLSVVALLAEKLGATVQLKALESGTAAIVELPTSVLHPS